MQFCLLQVHTTKSQVQDLYAYVRISRLAPPTAIMDVQHSEAGNARSAANARPC